MDTEPSPHTLWQLRHGQSDGNTRQFEFGGGHPDDLPRRGAIKLTPKGERQTEAAGLAACNYGITIGRIVTSNMLRAMVSAERFIAGYAGADDAMPYEVIDGLQEVSHGRLERQEPPIPQANALKLHRGNVAFMHDLLLGSGFDSHIARYAGWIVPTGFGDGETYLAAGIRAYTAFDQHITTDGTLVVGHHGAFRQARVLASHFNKAEREDLAAHYAKAFAETPDLGTLTYAIQRYPSAKREIGAVLTRLRAADMPTMQETVDFKPVGNGQLIEIHVGDDGTWRMQRHVTPQLPEEGPLTNSNVTAQVAQFSTHF